MGILTETKNLCKKYNVRPARSKGQHFLIKEKIYNKIVQAADVQPNDTVLEVGPGLGFLTERLAQQAKSVIAVELDDKLAAALRERLDEQGIDNVEVVNEDILKISNIKYQIPKKIQRSNFKKIPDTKYQILNTSYKIVANLPYNITSRFLRMFLSEVENKPTTMVLMIQKEVAERLVAKPGQMSLLAVSAQFYAEVKVLFNVSKDAFWPKPQVDSAVVELTTHLTPARLASESFAGRPNPSPYKGEGNRGEGRGEVNETQFFRLVKAGFSAKRKQLRGNLVKMLKIKSEDIDKILKHCGLTETVRAQELSLDDWRRLLIALQTRNVL